MNHFTSIFLFNYLHISPFYPSCTNNIVVFHFFLNVLVLFLYISINNNNDIDDHFTTILGGI